ncbi:MAG: sensor histidine kinase, partial [Aureliella sp.]
GRMAAGIAHELGTPLNVVAGRAALIASGRLSGDEVTASARTIKSEADRITSIVQRLLDFARGRRPQRVQCELVTIAQRTVSLLDSLAAKRDVQLEIETPSAPTRCFVDESQIQQVITNLIVNAVQATPAGGRVRLTIDRPEDAWLRLRVEDSGPGIPEELRERIFEPFFTTKEVGEGTGLGLSIAYGIVQEHGGRLEISQGELGGAAFDVWLPQNQSVSFTAEDAESAESAEKEDK